MEFLRHAVLLVHLVGFALLFGAWAVEAFGGRHRITGLMNIGLTLAALGGVILAAPFGTDGDLNYIKITVKLTILLVIGALMGIAGARQRRGAGTPSVMFWLVGVLTLTNAGIAVLW